MNKDSNYCNDTHINKNKTNADFIRSMSNEELAELFCHCTSEPFYDEGMDGEWQQIGYTDVWQSTIVSGYYDSLDDVYKAVLAWLNSSIDESSQGDVYGKKLMGV